MNRRSLSLLALVLALLASSAGGAAAALGRDDAILLVEQHLRAHGAQSIRELSRAFLFEGEARVHEEQLAHDACVGFLALGFGDVRDVDLAIHTRGGQPVAADVGIAPYAYARTCARADVQLYASAQLYAGRGELVMIRIENAPRDLGRLPLTLPLAVSAGGRLESSRDIGGPSDDARYEWLLEQAERKHAELGFVSIGPVMPFELRAGLATLAVPLAPRTCYRAFTLVPFVRGVGLLVQTAEERTLRVREPSADQASMAVCTGEGGTLIVRVEARVLRAAGFLRIFEHPRATPERAAASSDEAALAWAEVDHLARERGFSLAHVGDAWVESDLPHVWPVPLVRGACHVFATLGDGRNVGVDQRLVDPNGALVARNEGRRFAPTMFHCAQTTGVYRLVLRPRGLDTKVSVFLGSKP